MVVTIALARINTGWIYGTPDICAMADIWFRLVIMASRAITPCFEVAGARVENIWTFQTDRVVPLSMDG